MSGRLHKVRSPNALRGQSKTRILRSLGGALNNFRSANEQHLLSEHKQLLCEIELLMILNYFRRFSFYCYARRYIATIRKTLQIDGNPSEEVSLTAKAAAQQSSNLHQVWQNNGDESPTRSSRRRNFAKKKKKRRRTKQRGDKKKSFQQRHRESSDDLKVEEKTFPTAENNNCKEQIN